MSSYSNKMLIKFKKFSPFIWVILGIVTVIISVIVFAYSNVMIFEKTVVAQTQNNLLTIAKTEAKNIEHIIEHAKSELMALAKNSIIKQQVKNGIYGSMIDKKSYAPLSGAFRETGEMADAYYRIDSKGIVQERFPFKLGSEGSDYARKLGIKFVLENKKSYVTDIFTTSSRRKAFAICVPVFESKKFIGVLRAVFYLDSINLMIHQVKVSGQGYAQIIDDHGTIISHPQKSHIGKNIIKKNKGIFPAADWSGLEAVVPRMSRGETGVGRYHSLWWKDKNKILARTLIAFAPIKVGTHVWSIGINLEYDEIAKPIQKLSRSMFVIDIFLIVSVVAGCVFLFKNQAKKNTIKVAIESANMLMSSNAKLQSEIDQRVETERKLEDANRELKNDEQALKYIIRDGNKTKDELRVKELALQSTLDNFQSANEQLKKTQKKLVQSEKLAAIGQLSAGIAHEINNPMSFVSNNMDILCEYVETYEKIFRIVGALKASVKEAKWDEARVITTDMEKLEGELDLRFILVDILELIDASQRGIERVKKIVSDLRTFSREEKGNVESLVVKDIIEDILSIAHNELKYKAELIKEYGVIPEIVGSRQRLGQVFLNLLVNAVQAIEKKGSITIKTWHQDAYVYVEIKDTGNGIDESSLGKIFDPFFTTKPVGVGTGLGLSISYDIIKQHGGDIEVYSRINEGTRFVVKLPIIQSDEKNV